MRKSVDAWKQRRTVIPFLMLSFFLECFQASAICPFNKNSFADDKDEYGALEKTVSVSLCPPQIPHEPDSDRTRNSKHMSHGMALKI
jgi:hypothetical protein